MDFVEYFRWNSKQVTLEQRGVHKDNTVNRLNISIGFIVIDR